MKRPCLCGAEDCPRCYTQAKITKTEPTLRRPIKKPMNTKTFTLAQVLSITTERLCCDIGGIYEILNHITGDDLYTHVLPRAGKFAKPLLLQQFPQIAVAEACLGSLDKWLAKFKSAPERPDREKGDGSDAVRFWLTELRMMFPEIPQTFEVESHAAEWNQIDPIAELEGMIGEDHVIAVAI